MLLFNMKLQTFLLFKWRFTYITPEVQITSIDSCTFLMWWFKSFFLLYDLVQWLHSKILVSSGLWYFSLNWLIPWTFRLWSLKLFFCLNFKSQSSQKYFLLSPWTYFLWFSKLILDWKSFWQTEHFSCLGDCICFFITWYSKACIDWKPKSQLSHLNGICPSWLNSMCFFAKYGSQNFFSQKGQTVRW